MAHTSSESNRLLSTTGRNIGIAVTVAALICSCLPGALPFPIPLVPVLVLLVAIGACYLWVPAARTIAPAAIIVIAGAVTVVLIGVLTPDANAAALSAVTVVTGACIASVVVAIGIDQRTLAFTIGAFIVAMAALAVALIGTGGSRPRVVALVLVGWAFWVVLAVWLGRMAPQTVRRITSMGRAYRAERRASELEARRRQDARLLHDTVLATLTLLAHSGVGVREDALRQQAAEDAALLRQLRMGFTPNPSASGEYNLKPVQESTLGNTLESVKQRFRRMGLEVNWHGSGQVLLPSDTLDAFLLALAECLENVRRHSGAAQAHVTITDDEATVRAMVTDSGVGFDLDTISPNRLGFAESILARLRDVGGNARLFSSPGSGTTVVLEVPK